MNLLTKYTDNYYETHVYAHAFACVSTLGHMLSVITLLQYNFKDTKVLHVNNILR